ncbi:hypothetical protein D3C75_612620 [compost metagenome]
MRVRAEAGSRLVDVNRSGGNDVHVRYQRHKPVYSEACLLQLLPVARLRLSPRRDQRNMHLNLRIFRTGVPGLHLAFISKKPLYAAGSVAYGTEKHLKGKIRQKENVTELIRP